MTYKKNLLIIIIGVITLLGCVGVITYAYFSGSTNLTNGNLSTNAYISELNYYFEAQGGNDIELDVTYANMQAQRQGNIAASDNTNMNISFTSGEDNLDMYCTYDLVWVWDETDVVTNQYVKTTGATKEYTVSGTNGTQSFSEKQVNNYGTDTLLYTGYITSSSITETEQTWQINANFYNLDLNQNSLSDASFKSKVKVENVNCEVGQLGISTMFGGFSNMILAHNGGAATIEAKGSPNFSTISPAIVSYTDTNFSGSSITRTPTGTNYFTYSDPSDPLGGYTFDTTTGKYTLVNPQVCQYSSCYDTLVGKYVVSYSGSSSSTPVSSTNRSTIYEIESTTSSTITYKESTWVRNFETTSRGMYAAEDDFGTSYYYRGNVENNWVKLDGATTDMYFRIIRINGDGTVRMIYTGTTAPTEAEKSVMTGPGTQLPETKAFNTSVDSAEYVGYRYTLGESHGTSVASNIKGADSNPESGTVDKWYIDNILTNSKYVNAISQEQVLCNDSTAYTQSSSYPNYTYALNPTGGTGKTITYYGPFTRLYYYLKNHTPTLGCSNTSDEFTVAGARTGNKALQYPVGLITADEVAMAGGKYNSYSYGYYLNTGKVYWTASAFAFNGNYASVFRVDSSGILNGNSVGSAFGVRPVVSLKSDIEVTGTGQWNDPYVVDGT